jgi:organic radical activating enzyme
MAKLKVAEIFYSIQGEGRYMGVPSIFLRTFGCNFQCDGFGMPKGEKTNERHQVDASQFKLYSELPLVSSGCDSYASWDPRFKHLSPVLDTEVVAEQILQLLPQKKWVDEHLVITGGEPLLGWQKAYPDLLDHPSFRGQVQELTFETNGTQPLSAEFDTYLFEEFTRHGRDYDKLTFSVSAKLPCSGEKWEDAIKPDVVMQYQQTGYTYLKFVITNIEDLADAKKAVEEYRTAGFNGPVYLMPVGGVESVYQLNNRSVAEMAMNNGWRYSDRLQVPLFKNEWGT